MSIINYASREIQFKIVYYGPALCGKTTNLAYIHERISPANRGDLVSLATAADRTLFFDFLPLNAVVIKGFVTKFQLYTVPGQVIYNATRQLVLRSVDGVVFVADSQWEKMEENVESFRNLEETSLSKISQSTRSLTFCSTTSAISRTSPRQLPRVPVEQSKEARAKLRGHLEYGPECFRLAQRGFADAAAQIQQR
jgi:signal recognition particle receptor subunit beta